MRNRKGTYRFAVIRVSKGNFFLPTEKKKFFVSRNDKARFLSKASFGLKLCEFHEQQRQEKKKKEEKITRNQ